MPDSDHLIIPAKYLDELRTKEEDLDMLKSFTDVSSDFCTTTMMTTIGHIANIG